MIERLIRAEPEFNIPQLMICSRFVSHTAMQSQAAGLAMHGIHKSCLPIGYAGLLLQNGQAVLVLLLSKVIVMVISNANQLLIELDPCEYQGLVIWITRIPENADSPNREVMFI